ncbi:polysaccharide biosynthesis protein [Macrococcoides caseolyticum]|uniref:polysaccharide biosynthesis protein n=1 Tax=Macrococcoides caseolyticum TaxID=69966 RepID=UPI0024BD154A|nr:nucleoside-diphosphate sugar epimerase/dehydratase [Macrococcus caseolyticus]MDJ1088761.1 nucleoside-diphosphate sugar epimerase/dehydratase [Macrococcus caseolyticus]
MNNKQRYILLLLIDSIIVTFSVFVGYYLLSPFLLEYSLKKLVFSSVILLMSHHIFAYIFNLYHRAWEYASVRELISIFKAVSCSIIFTYFINLIFFNTSFTRLMIITWMMHLILIGGSRLSWRIFRHRIIGKTPKVNTARTTLIVGAGRGGTLLIRQLLEIPTLGMKPIVAVDDDPSKLKLELIGGIKVEGNRYDISKLVQKYEIQKIVIAIPSLSKSELNKIYDIANECKIDVFTMPNIDDVLAGKLEVSKLKKVEVEDLLGREPVVLDTHAIKNQIENKTILVTGAGGSIGSEIVRQVTKFSPRKIILLGHGENSIYLILEEMNLLKNNICYIPVIADVQDKRRLDEVFEKYKPDIVYHAAAHKHVPLMEENEIESLKNNVLGTKNAAEISISHGVSKFVMISTDKAVNPPNVMGATKRLAEMIIQSLDKESENTTLVAVRFGNVLGSRGSVIPKFKKQIELGGPITVTDERMTRYFMTIPEASRLVIQAGSLARGGEIFVLDMGDPVKIVDLAKNMIKLSGFKEGEIQIEFSGIRPGEKLYEELLSTEEIKNDQVFEKIYVGKSTVISLNSINEIINKMIESNNVKGFIFDFIQNKR